MKTKKNTLLLIFALALCLSVAVGASLAYFSDYEEASGGATLSLGGQTELYEGTDSSQKDISIKNTGDTDMIVRVIISSIENMKEEPSYNKNDWLLKDGFYYYKKVLKPGESTSEIVAKMEFSWGPTSDPKEPEYSFDVVVAHEGAQAVYNGKALARPDETWDKEAVAAIEIPEDLKGVN